jgi:serine/threonine-protein kinase
LTLKGLALGLAKKALLLLALALTAGLSAFLTMRAILSSQEVSVPRLVNERLIDASARAAERQLLVKVEGRRHDARIAAGRIAAQEPEAGATLKSQRSVRVWLSVGPQRIRVPDVLGQSLRSARLAFEQAQLPVEHVVEVYDPAPEGTVVVQRPPAGEADALAGGVALLVSRGPAGGDYVMPDLIGRDAATIVEALRRAGLKVADVRYRAYAGVAPGIVLRQVPQAGARVRRSDPVSLDVSKVS